MEKINIVELLKNCPQGMELDCTMFDEVKLVGVDEICITRFPIKVNRGDGCTLALTKYGQYADADFAKCVIFPKGKTTWEGFVPPYKFKDGDVVVCKEDGMATQMFILKSQLNYDKGYCYTGYDFTDNKFFEEGDWYFDRLATEEEKEKLFNAIKANGYKWNAEKKELERLVVPKFKVGDRIRHKLTGTIYKVLFVLSNGCGGGVYDVAITNEIGKSIDVTEQDNYELVPNKFNIDTLKAFESRVLVRDKNIDEWRGQFYSHYYESKRSDKPYICIGVEGLCEYKQCIPYEGNEHLLGTTSDCSEYYKTWE